MAKESSFKERYEKARDKELLSWFDDGKHMADWTMKWMESQDITEEWILALKNEVEYLNKKLAQQSELLDDCETLISHALELGHLGQGSTNGWAKQVLTKLKARNK